MEGSPHHLTLTELKQLGLPADDLYALLEFALRKMAQRDVEYARALSETVLGLGKRCRGARRILKKDYDPAEAIPRMLQDALTTPLMRKRDEGDSVHDLILYYGMIFGPLTEIPRCDWSAYTQEFWTAAGKPGRILGNVHEEIRKALESVRTPRQAALSILAVCLGKSRESLEK